MNVVMNLDVDDVDRAVNFYRDAFGMQPGRRFAFGVEMLGGPVPLYLLHKAAGSAAFDEAATQAHALRNYARHWTPLHLDIVVDDIDAAIARALAAGALQESATVTDRWGKLALMSDPFGHGFCLVQFLGRGYDEIAM